VAGATAVALAGLVAGCGARAAPDQPGAASVVRVVDGDTVEVVVAGQHETVRLLGIDTPETLAPGRPVECFGPEATAFLQELLPEGTAVELARDTEARDRFGRLLAYVTRADDQLFVNAAVAAGGYADVLVLAPNTARAGELVAAVADAKARGAGRWSACPAGP